MIFLGLAGMIDPPRKEIKQAIKDCAQKGVCFVHMLTAGFGETGQQRIAKTVFPYILKLSQEL